MKKLLGSRGETMTETLAAILIVAMSAVILATMTAVSVRITRSANAASAELYTQISAAESDLLLDTGTAEITMGGSPAGSVDITIYGIEKGLVSYRGAGE